MSFSLSSLSLTVETDSFSKVQKKIEAFGKKYGPKNVLVVLDIDNTILTMPQDLGSDQWFNWQYSTCLKQKKRNSDCAATDMKGLLDLQGKIFSFSKMTPTEKNLPFLIKKIQKEGYKMFLLTSRGHAFRNSTERELKRNSFDFSSSAIGPKRGFAGTYVPYDPKELGLYGLSAGDATSAGLKEAGREVSYMNGLMMTAGLNKGIMLKTLLHKTKSKFKAVVFVDDHKKHTESMEEIIGKDKSLELATFRYSKIDPVVKKFEKNPKDSVIKDQKVLRETLNSLFK